jgi:hypothetical protein
MNEIPKLTRRRAVELAGAAGAAAVLTGVKGPGRLLDGDKLLVPLTADGSGGYAGTFVAGLTGLPETTTTTTTGSDSTGSTDTGNSGANAVLATLAATHFHRNAAGRRVLRLKPEVAGLVAAEGGGSAAPFARRRVALLRSSPPRRSRAGPICRRTT